LQETKEAKRQVQRKILLYCRCNFTVHSVTTEQMERESAAQCHASRVLDARNRGTYDALHISHCKCHRRHL